MGEQNLKELLSAGTASESQADFESCNEQRHLPNDSLTSCERNGKLNDEYKKNTLDCLELQLNGFCFFVQRP